MLRPETLGFDLIDTSVPLKTVSDRVFLRFSGKTGPDVHEDETKRLSLRVRRMGVSDDPFQAVVGVDRKRLAVLNSSLRGVWYVGEPLIMRDLIPNSGINGFLANHEYPFPLPDSEVEKHEARFDALKTFHPTDQGWAYRFAIVNRRTKGTARSELRIGVHMLDDKAINLLQQFPAGIRALRRFRRISNWACHDNTSHASFHPNDEPAFLDWSRDVQSDELVTYKHGEPIPNYELLSCIAHRKQAEHIFKHQPGVRSALVNDFYRLNDDMEHVMESIRVTDVQLPSGATRAGAAVGIHAYMMTIAKSMFFHVIDPRASDVSPLIAKHPFLGKNNKLMTAIHEHDGIPLVSSDGRVVPAEDIIRRYESCFEKSYSQQ